MALVELCPAELSFCRRASSFLQSDFWGNFKARFGWQALAFSAEWENTDTAADLEKPETITLPLLVLYRRLGPGIGFAYIPWGPELPAVYNEEASRKAAAELAAALRLFLPKDTAFIRFDFPWHTDEVEPEKTGQKTAQFKKTFTRAAADVQPPDTVLVDLSPDEAVILGAMKPKWRYNIGLAEKKGVSVRSVSACAIAGDLEIFYQLYKETASRDGISIHGKIYYETLFEEAEKHSVDLRLYLASHEGECISGIITLFRGEESTYLYGASSNHKRNLMAPYALQWQAMKDAKAAGCRRYDLFGIPPRPPEEDPNHPMAGLYRFKTGFIGEGEGGKIIRRPGSWDYSCRPLVQTLYLMAEKGRKKSGI